MIILLDCLAYNLKEQYKLDEPQDRPEYRWWTESIQKDLLRLEFEVEHTLQHRALCFQGHATDPEYRRLLQHAALFVHEFVGLYRRRRHLQGRGDHEYPKPGPPIDPRQQPRENTVPGLELPDPHHIERVQWKAELDAMIGAYFLPCYPDQR